MKDEARGEASDPHSLVSHLNQEQVRVQISLRQQPNAHKAPGEQSRFEAVEAGAERFRAKATEVKDQERRRLFDLQAAKMPGFAEYERTTARVIPVFVLEPVAV